MKLEDIALILRTRQEAVGLSVLDVATRGRCPVREAGRALAGDPEAPIGALEAVCAALGYEVSVRPRTESEDGTGSLSGPAFRAAAEMVRRRERRLAMHQVAVQVLRERPESAARVLESLNRRADTGIERSATSDEWRRILEERDWVALLEQSEYGDYLRTGSPFVFVLNAEERLATMKSFPRLP